VVLGPSHATWSKLYEALARLAADCGGSFAFVIDEGNGLWCVGIPGLPPVGSTPRQDRLADGFYAAEIVPRMKSMQRGARFDAIKTTGDAGGYCASSFAGIYAVVVWFEDPSTMTPFLVRAKVRRTIPAIEALVLALPPSGGPGTERAAAKLRA
jgi:hypothetical protein